MRPLLLGLLALCAVPRTGAGQAVRGKVAVLDIADPIPGAAVVLLGSDGRPHDAVLTDSAGSFALHAPYPGSYLIHAFAPGFAEARSRVLELAAGRTVEVRVNLRPVAVVLEGITVYGRDRYAGFHQRRGVGRTFRYGAFDARDIQRIGAARVRDVLTEVPLFRGRCFTAWLDGRRLDGDEWLWVWLFGEVADFPAFPVTSLYGVEVFRNRSDAPREYQLGGDAHCGVVLVWTKALGARR